MRAVVALVAVLLVGVAPAVSAQPAGTCPDLPAAVEPDPDRPRYDAVVSADPDSGLVTGSVIVTFTPDLPTDRVVLRLWPNGPRPRQAGVSLEVGGVTDLRRAASLVSEQPDPTTLVVHPHEPLEADDTIVLRVPFTLEVPGGLRDRWSRSAGSLRAGSFLPLLAWEPGVGWATEPATTAFAEASTSPTADYHVTVHVPAGYGVLATGVPDGLGTWHGTAVRDFAMSVGRFSTASATAMAPEPVAVTVGVHDTIGEDPAAYLDRQVQALEDFAARFGPYPWPVLTLAITPAMQGGIEFPTHIMQGPGSIGRTTPHEVGHEWFYGIVGNNQARDPWLDEGLATYAESVIQGRSTLAAMAVPASAQGRVGEPMSFWEDRSSDYYRGVYVQGAQAVASLGEPDLVDCALRHYVAANRFGIATPADFLDAMSVVFPDVREQLAPYGITGS